MSPRRPLLARALSALIVGDDAEVVRGDLEESHHRRLADGGSSWRTSAAAIEDAAVSLMHWWLGWSVRHSRTAHRSPDSGGRMSTFIQDLRQMWRALVRQPTYAAMVALTLGLGIGATTTIYGVVDAMLVKPLPYGNADRLVLIGNVAPGREWLEGREGLQRLEEISLPNFRDLQSRVRGLAHAAALERRNWMSVSPEHPPEILDVANVQQGFFELLSVKPFMGRLPHDGDQATGARGKWGAVISYAGWQRRFGGDPGIIGKEIGSMTIIGVLPRDFVQPAAIVGSDVEFWMHLDPSDSRYTDRRRRGLKILARLEPGASLASIRREVTAAQTQLAAEQPDGNVLPGRGSLGAGLNSLRDATVGTGHRSVLVFLGAALLLLVLAGTNAANLLIVRGLERDGELSLRRALGASRARLTMTLIMESVSLALAGGVIGLGIAVVGISAFRRFGPQSLPRMNEVAANFRIVTAGVMLSLAIGILVGLIPAIRSSGADLLSNLRASLTAIGPRGNRLRTSLAAIQLSLALVLGIGASLLFRSFVYLRTERLGFEPAGLVGFSVAFKKDRPWEMWDRVLATVSTLPGVTSVAGASSLPFETPKSSMRVAPAEQTGDAPITATATYAVSPTFFETAKIPVLQGRVFDSSDQPESRRVAIVNERFAKTAFGDRSPIGRYLTATEGAPPGEILEVVGVVGNVVQARVEDGVLPAIYVPHTQRAAILNVLISTKRTPAEIEREVRRGLVDVGLSTAPVIGLSSMQDRIGRSLATPRFQLMLIGAFAGTAVLLAAIGLYGTLAFTVRARTRELGIRMAMGATQRQIFDLVLRQGMSVLGIGLVLGLAGAIAVTRLLQGFLYRVSPVDPIAFAGAILTVALAVVLAVVRPAGRAARVDPVVSMRS
ncbi:MAG TPA: ADOP family duplicated permease [Gemmatimonadaceae bacterium]